MITSCKLTGSAAKIAAYHSSEENYYFSQAAGVESLAGDNVAGGPQIHGNLAEVLGFKDGARITERDLTNLLSARNSAGEQVGREHKVIGIDLTFSAPKSVSVAGLLTGRDPSIIASHDRAVLETMREVERYCAGTQKYIDGEIKQVKTGNMAYVTVRDGFNREHDPHLHTHVVVMNLTSYGDKIMALDGRQVMRYDFNKMWGAMYRAKLAANLKEAGHSVSYTKKGELRLDSVSLEVEREFSKRRAEIVAAKEGGLSDMEAWRKTRKAKDPKVEKVNVLEDWRARVERYQAKTVEQNKADVRIEREAWTREAAFSVEARQELSGERGDSEAARWQAAARRATERTAAVSANVLITEYLTEVARGESWEPITYSVAEQRLMAEVRAGRLLATDDGRYTTWEMTHADRQCVRERLAPAGLALAPDAAARQVREYVQKNLEGGLRGLSGQQAAAAAGILSAERGTVVVQGDAGAGKTTMLRAVHDIAAQQGWETVGLSIQGVAARKLQEESGIKSVTVSSYLARERAAGRVDPGEAPAARQPRLVVIDEASMNDSRGLAELMGHADKHGDKIVLVGDRNQIQSVGAGRPFDRLVASAEASGQLLSLCENYRQRNKDLREAVDMARDGRMRESIDLLARTGRVLEIQDTNSRRLAVAMQYDKGTLILAGSRESRDALNGLIRGDLTHRGIIDRSTARTYTLSWADADGVKQTVEREFAKGDIVTFLKNDYRKDFDVRNGERGEVLKTSKDGLTVRLEDGRAVDVDIHQYGALDHAYAMTTYKSQGQTYDKVVIEADTTAPQLQDQRNTYVQITRARDDVRVFTDDKGELREIAGVLNDKTDTFGVKASLEKAAAMERRVHAEAFGDRARLEAGAKIVQAESWAAAKAEKIQQAATEGLPKGVVVVVSNETLMRELGQNDRAREEWSQRFDVVSRKLNDTPGLTPEDKRVVAAELGKPESVSALRSCAARPELAVAFGAMKAEVGDLNKVTKGIDPDACSDVRKLVAWAKNEKEQILSREATDATKDVQAPDAAETKGLRAERTEFDASRNNGLAVEANQAADAAANAARELQEARSAEKVAAEAARAAVQSHNDAKVPWYEAQTRLEKAPFWDKPAAQIAEKEARQGLEVAYEKSKAAGTALREAHEKLEKAKALSREAEARSAEAARRNIFQGTPEAVAEVVKTNSAVQEARRDLEEARAVEQEARRASDAERHRYGEARQDEFSAQSRVSQAEESVRKALPWEKKEARVAEKEAQRGLDAVKERLADIEAARESAMSREAQAREMVKAAEAKLAEAQTLAAGAAHSNDLQATQEAFRARTDFTPAEHNRVEEYLSRDAGAEILRGCDNPQQAIAAGSIACGIRSADEATKGMEKSAAAKVVDSVERQQQAERMMTRQSSQDFGLSL